MPVSTPSVLGASLYIGGRTDALANLAKYLGVLPGNVRHHAHANADYGFYARQENSIRWAAVSGDFFLACDVDLFHLAQDQLRATLKALSTQGVTIAMPDEASQSPLEYWVFENGTVKKVVILQDDDTDTVTIWRGEQPR